jgi:hypothetical protein
MGVLLRRGLISLSVALLVFGSLSMVTSVRPVAAANQELQQLTPAGAEQVYTTTWQKFAYAFVQGQLDALHSLATPHVIDIVAASTGCGCSWDTPHSKVVFSIPFQRSYPESFLAQISTPAPPHSIYSPFVTMVVFTKSAASKPWLVAYFVRYAGTMTYLSHTIVGSAPPTLLPITSAVRQLVDFLTAMVTTGTPPPNDNWTVSGTLADELQNYLQTKEDVAAGGDQQQTVFTALENSVAFAYPRGDIVCSSYSSQSTVTPSTGSPPIVQPSDQYQWGSLLAPGTYSSLSKLGMHDVCFSIDTTNAPQSNDTETISFQGGVYQISGVPSPAPSSPASGF